MDNIAELDTTSNEASFVTNISFNFVEILSLFLASVIICSKFIVTIISHFLCVTSVSQINTDHVTWEDKREYIVL